MSSLALLLALAACASSRQQHTSLALAAGARPALVFGNTVEAVQQGESVYQFLERRSPNSLRLRDPIATMRTSQIDPPIGVYIDGTFMGGPEVLQTVLATDVISVRRLSMSQTSVGIDRHHSDGIIEVKLRHE